MLSLTAESVSRSIRQGLDTTPLPLRVLAAFDNACDLVAADGRVVALVARDVGNGPLNIVVNTPLSSLPLPPAGAPASISSRRLIVGDIEVGLAGADWEPRPNWSYLRPRCSAVRARLPALAQVAHRYAPPHSLLSLLAGVQPSPQFAAPVLDVFRQALAQLPSAGAWLPGQVAQVAARLGGLGWGLTPCGDDWLAGLLAWAWLAHPHPTRIGEAVVRSAIPRTTTLSAAFLRGAALGEYDAAWHDLLAALAADSAAGLNAATLAVLAHGATSGADMLAGFLYAAENH